MANIAIVRRMKAGNFCVGFFLVDLLCLGVKDCFYQFNLLPSEYQQLKEDFILSNEKSNLSPTNYPLVHNIIYEGLAFAEDCGFQPHKDFSFLKFFFDEDDDRIETIDIPLGYDGSGVPALFSAPHQPYTREIKVLEKRFGPDGFFLVHVDEHGNPLDEDEDGEEDEEEEEDAQIYNWEENDPEVLINDLENEESDDKINDFFLNSFTHPMDNEEFRESVLTYLRKKESPKLIEVNALFEEFKQSPYLFFEKPVSQDAIVKLHSLLIGDCSIDDSNLEMLNVWQQGLNISFVDDEDKPVSIIDDSLAPLLEKANDYIEKGKEKKVKDIISKLEKAPYEVRNEAFYEELIHLCRSVLDDKRSFEYAKTYYERYPSFSSKFEYMSSLANEETDDEFLKLTNGSFRLSDIFETNDVTIIEISNYLTLMIGYFSFRNLKYSLEVMRVAKETPYEYRPIVGQLFMFKPFSAVLKNYAYKAIELLIEEKK